MDSRHIERNESPQLPRFEHCKLHPNSVVAGHVPQRQCTLAFLACYYAAEVKFNFDGDLDLCSQNDLWR